MEYQGIIFDFNGTLFFDNDKHVKAWNEISKILRGKEITLEELHTKLNGTPNIQNILYFTDGKATKEELENLPLVSFDKIVKSKTNYILVNGEYVKESDSKNLVAIENRKKEYPPLAEQLDMIYHDLENGTSNWQTLIKSIKEKYPKE